MAFIASFVKTGIALMALVTYAFSLSPLQDSVAPKSEVRKRIVEKSSDQLEAAATARVEPAYPEVARWAAVGGLINVYIVVNEQGEVIVASARTGPALLKNAAATAAQGWKFKPEEMDGKPVKVSGFLRIHFTADASQPPSAPPDADRTDIDEAKEAVRAFPAAAEAYYWLGTTYADDDQNKEAETAFNRAIELKPDYEEAYLGLVELYSKSKASADVLRTFQQAIDKIPNSWILLASYAGKLAEAKRAAEIVNIAKRAIEINPDDLNTRLMLAWAYKETQRHEDALAEISQAIKLDPQNPLAHLYLAGTLATLKRYDEALAEYRQVTAMKANDADLHMVYRDLGTVLLQLRRPQEALESFNQAAQLKADVPYIYCGLSNAYLMLSRWEESIQAAKKGIQAQPDDACSYNILGIAHASLGKFAEAEQAFRKTVELHPETLESNVNLVRALTEQKKVAEAKLVMQQAHKRLSDNVQLYIYFGSILGQLHQRTEAEAEYREALRLDPNNALALNNLGYSIVERGEKVSEGLEMIQRAVNAEPNNGAYLDSLGWAYYKLGRLEEAERYLSQAVQGAYQSLEIYEHLGDVYEKEGKREFAMRPWQKALSLAKDEKDSSRLKAKLSGQAVREK